MLQCNLGKNLTAEQRASLLAQCRIPLCYEIVVQPLLLHATIHVPFLMQQPLSEDGANLLAPRVYNT